MSKLITRQIDPRIEIINKILVFMTPLLLLSLINFGGLGYIKLVLGVGCIALGIYELYIYKTNEEFISLVEADKNHLAYKLIVKYYKLGFLILLFTSLKIFKDAFWSHYFSTSTLNGIVILLLTYYILINIFILREDLIKILVKNILLFIVIIIVNRNLYFGYYREVSMILIPIISFQILYLFFSLNTLYLAKNSSQKLSYLNYDLIISLLLVVIYEVTAVLIVNLASLTIQYAISYLLVLVAILGLNDSLKKYYKVKKTRYSKIVKYYFIGLIFILPLMYLILDPISDIASFMNSEYATRAFVCKAIIYFIIIELINIVVLILYKFKKYIFKYDFISKANEIYDRWM